MRIANDVSSYYLLSYYSTGKLDGKFHAINVRVNRPGVDVRARRGYLAATEADVRSRPASTASATPSDSRPRRRSRLPSLASRRLRARCG